MTPGSPRPGPPAHRGPPPGAGAPGPPSIPSTPGRAVGADPDVDGVALAAATATGVLLGSRFAAVAAWVTATCCLAVVCLWAAGAARIRGEGAGVAQPASQEERNRDGGYHHRVGVLSEKIK